MIEIKHSSLIIGLFIALLSTSTLAEGFIKKEVYSFKDKSGNIVFTDRLPAKKQAFKTQTIEAANSTGNSNGHELNFSQNKDSSQANYNQQTYVSNNYVQPQKVIIVNSSGFTNKTTHKKKRVLKRCKTYKKKLAYYSDKMKAGYKNSEYKKLETNRRKYKDLLFNNCETKTFDD